MNPDEKHWSRQTYSLLDFLGDLGGLQDALFVLGLVVTGPFAAFNMQATLLSEFFYVRKDAAGRYTGVHSDIRGGVERGRKLELMTEKLRHIV